jgi:ferredoxin
MRMNVDPGMCTGCMFCALMCPAVFTMGEEGRAAALPVSVTDEMAGSCVDAVEGCPSAAITIEP